MKRDENEVVRVSLVKDRGVPEVPRVRMKRELNRRIRIEPESSRSLGNAVAPQQQEAIITSGYAH
jgi:hypothetical protein